MSPVDEILAEGAGYLDMDFPTRDLYRSAIEDLARGSNCAELDVAHRAVLAAEQAASVDESVEDGRGGEPGYYLLAGGRREFEREIDFRPALRTRLSRLSRALGIAGYIAALGDGDKAGGLFSLLNPINHARTPAEVRRYKVEPYVVAADVYATAPHVGRGGWTWYTGSAGWMQRAGVESILKSTGSRGDIAPRPPHPEGLAGL